MEGIKIGKEWIWSLGYVDDVVLVAEDEREMRSAIETMEGLDRKRFELKKN